MPFASWANPWTRPTSDDGYRFSPLHLGPYAWYDANLGGSSTEITDSSSNSRAAVTNGAGSNAAKWLPYDRPSLFLPPSTSNITTSVGNSHDLSVQTNQSYRFRLKIDSLGTVADTYYSLLVQDAASPYYALLPYIALNGSMLFATYDPGFNGSGTLGDLTTYLGQWIDIWFKYVHGSPNATVTGYIRTDMTKTLADNTGWTALLSSTVKAVGIFTPSATYAYSIAPAGGGEVTLNELAVWLSDTPSGNPVMNFKASGCTQASYTDPITSHVYTITRPAAGRKAVIQSPAANSARNLFLLGVDDYLDIPAAALPDLAANSTHVIVGRTHATPTFYDTWWGRKSVLGVSQGIVVRHINTTGEIETIWRSTAPTEYSASTGVLTFGTRKIISSVRESNTATTYANNTVGTPVSISGTFANSEAGQIGRDRATGSLYTDMEFEAFLTFDRALSATEVAKLVAYYGGGL